MRVMSIIQLCLAFTALAWYAIYPFMGEWYAVKSQKLLFEMVMGKNDEKNTKLFQELPYSEQNVIAHEYDKLLAKREASFATKTAFIFQILIKEISPFELAWIFFSIVISVLALLSIKGVEHAVWLLPTLTLFYGIDSYMKEVPQKRDSLFPTEKTLVDKYLNGSNDGTIAQQRAGLEHAWKMYLVEEWGHETPAKEDALLHEQSTKAFHAFNVALLKQSLEEKGTTLSYSATTIALPIVLIYLVWNLLFAWTVSRQYKHCLI